MYVILIFVMGKQLFRMAKVKPVPVTDWLSRC